MLPHQTGGLIEAEDVTSLPSLKTIKISAGPTYSPNNYNSFSSKKAISLHNMETSNQHRKTTPQAQEPKTCFKVQSHMS